MDMAVWKILKFHEKLNDTGRGDCILALSKELDICACDCAYCSRWIKCSFPLPQSEAGIKETGNYCGNNVQMGENLRVLG